MAPAFPGRPPRAGGQPSGGPCLPPLSRSMLSGAAEGPEARREGRGSVSEPFLSDGHVQPPCPPDSCGVAALLRYWRCCGSRWAPSSYRAPGESSLPCKPHGPNAPHPVTGDGMLPACPPLPDPHSWGAELSPSPGQRGHSHSPLFLSVPWGAEGPEEQVSFRRNGLASVYRR